MLERHGIVTRETAIAEGIPGGFAAIYGELQNLELLGTARRGYFVEGLGGAQFALPGAVERLRSLPRADGELLSLAATDPANPYGATLPWPKLEGQRRPASAPRRLRRCCATASRCSTSSAAAEGILRLAAARGRGARPRRSASWSGARATA